MDASEGPGDLDPVFAHFPHQFRALFEISLEFHPVLRDCLGTLFNLKVLKVQVPEHLNTIGPDQFPPFGFGGFVRYGV